MQSATRTMELRAIEPADRLAGSPDPVVAYKTRTLVFGEDPSSAEMQSLRAAIAASAKARDLLRHRDARGHLPEHAYRKWQGPHWTLVQLALIDYPPGDASLGPLFDQIDAWLFGRAHLTHNTITYPGQGDRVRRCASQEGNAIWYSMRLGFAGPRTRELVDRLVAYQWPDGGWNCDRRPEARASSFQETTIPLRGLFAYWLATGYEPARAAATRAAERLLSRRLLWRARDGALVEPDWGGAVDRIWFPTQFHDVMFALQVMAEAGFVRDPRCADALDVLETKRLPDGGFPLEEMNARRSETVASRASWTDWGPAGRRHANPLVTAIALGILAAAGRLRPVR